jgi:hypothetical protein
MEDPLDPLKLEAAQWLSLLLGLFKTTYDKSSPITELSIA